MLVTNEEGIPDLWVFDAVGTSSAPTTSGNILTQDDFEFEEDAANTPGIKGPTSQAYNRNSPGTWVVEAGESATSTPEPGTFALLFVGIASGALKRHRMKLQAVDPHG
jgi:hypothetical protein